MPRTPDSEDDDEEKVSLTVRFPKSVLEGLRRRAKIEERALNTVFIRAAREYLDSASAIGVFDKKKGR